MRYGKTLLNYCIEFKAVITQTVILQAYMTLFPLKYLNSSERFAKIRYGHIAFLLFTTF